MWLRHQTPKLREGSMAWTAAPAAGVGGGGGDTYHQESFPVPSEMPVGEWKPTDAQDRLRTEHKPRAPA